MVRDTGLTGFRHHVGGPVARGLVLAVGLVAGAGLAQAECLYDSFKQAYASNPVLAEQRAAVRIGVQDQEIAGTGYRPDVSANSDYGYHDQKGSAPGNPKTEEVSHPRGYGVSLSQNIWNGFKTSNSVAREGASLDADRADLRNVEQKILVDVATAYMDVLRDASIVELRRNNGEMLVVRAKQTRYLYQIGQMTLTDVDQSDASVAKSQADLALAKTSLDASRAVFRSIVSRDPGKLEPAAVPRKLLPRDLATALGIAQTNHPAILAAMNAVRAAELNVDVQKSGYLPSLDLTASADRRWDPDFYPAKTVMNDVSVVGRLTVPLYDRGLTTASVHRANELTGQRMAQLDNQRAEIRASVVQSWGLFDASRIVIASAEAQIVANNRALIGVQLEATAGQRTTFDVLTAQQVLLNSRVDREIAEHDRIISGYKLLASTGRLSLDNLTPADTRGAGTGFGSRLSGKPSSAALETISGMPLRPGL